MSALPPIADIGRLGRDVRFVPEADMQRWRDVEAERPGRLEIDRQFVLGRLLDRHLGRLATTRLAP